MFAFVIGRLLDASESCDLIGSSGGIYLWSSRGNARLYAKCPLKLGKRVEASQNCLCSCQINLPEVGLRALLFQPTLSK